LASVLLCITPICYFAEGYRTGLFGKRVFRIDIRGIDCYKISSIMSIFTAVPESENRAVADGGICGGGFRKPDRVMKIRLF
jgi:hypothetical protein